MVPATPKEEFLTALQKVGNVSEVCKALGIHRATAYHWRNDALFNQAWEEALRIRRDSIRDDLVDKAMAATGTVIEEPLLDAAGNPVLDEDFEPVMKRRLTDYDPKILSVMLNKFVHSEDRDAPETAVQVNIANGIQLPSRPRLAPIDAEFEEIEP